MAGYFGVVLLHAIGYVRPRVTHVAECGLAYILLSFPEWPGIEAIVHKAARALEERRPRILITAPSNAAIDHIVMQVPLRVVAQG